jgi:ribonuclease P protein component
VAFAVGRAVGSAVTRNKLRRRLRALLTEQPLPPGLYLFGASPSAAALSFADLGAELHRLLSKLSPAPAPRQR